MKLETRNSPKDAVQTEDEKPSDISRPKETTISESIERESTESLAPPPRPAQQIGNGNGNGNGNASGNGNSTSDYFSGNHGNLSHETNPFEFSFAGGSSNTNGSQVQTPGGTKLPSIASITSPAGILGPGSTPGPWTSLRFGPLSPAMLSAPQKDDYFSAGHHLRSSFPTPNESSLRSGLTPGGGGSMFPEPSPNSQYITGVSGTPGLLEFQRTGVSAEARAREANNLHQNVTSQPQEHLNTGDQHEANNDATNAANGLYLLANQPTQQETNRYTMASQIPVHAHPQVINPNISGPTSHSPPTANHRRSLSTTSGREGEISGGFSDNEQTKPATARSKGRKATPAVTNGRRKATDTPAKGHPNKRFKGSHGITPSAEPASEEEEEEEEDTKQDDYHANGKKMTEEEKRKNFLERNRVAALKCRQRKKQWLNNLQAKVELYSSENEQLTSQVQALRQELVNMKTTLLAHKDCPISLAQGINVQAMISGDSSSYTQLNGPMNGSIHGQMNGQITGQMNPYGMAAMNGQPQQVQQQQHQQQQTLNVQSMQPRRFS